MATDTKEPPKTTAEPTKPVKSAAKAEQSTPVKGARTNGSGGWSKFLKGNCVAILLAGSVFLNGLGLAYFRLNPAAKKSTPNAEVALGKFQFVSYHSEADQVVQAEFAIHIALNEAMEKQARERMEERKFRLQQDIEELLRAAHSGDFDDPMLRGMKRKLEERVNKTLGMRATADIIITDLTMVRNAAPSEPTEEAVELVPWVDPDPS